MPTALETAIDRLKNGYYNLGSKTDANPGGLGADGHRDNWEPMLAAIGLVTEHVGTQGDLASAVLAIQAEVTAVAEDSEAIGIVAEDIAAVLAAAANMAAIIAAPTHAATATTKAGEAADSATAAAASAAGVNLPPVEEGDAGKYLRVTPEEDGYVLKEPNDGPGTLVALDGSGRLPAAFSPPRLVATKDGAYTVIGTDAGKVLSCTGSFTLSLTAAATLGAGFVFGIVNAGTGVITIDPDGSEIINGRTTIKVYPGEQFDCVCTGSAWQTLGRTYGAVTILNTSLGSAVGIVDIEVGFDDPELFAREIFLAAAPALSSSSNPCVLVKVGASYVTSGYTSYGTTNISSTEASGNSTSKIPFSDASDFYDGSGLSAKLKIFDASGGVRHLRLEINGNSKYSTYVSKTPTSLSGIRFTTDHGTSLWGAGTRVIMTAVRSTS